jgi:chemotaxis protein histidine kinase CheA
MVAMTGASDKASHVAASCSNAVSSTVCEKAEDLAPASDWKAAAMAACDKSWAAAAKSRYKEVREAAARHYAEEAAAAGKKRATRKKRMSQESIDFLLARAKEPRPVLRVDHEFLDSLKTLTTERREEMRAAKTMVVVNLQALRDWEDDIVRRYHTDGYVEIEVDEEDSDDGKL